MQFKKVEDEMYSLSAYAIREAGNLEVVVSGNLANSCMIADIVDKYPGGRVVYVQDPGAAQVFVEESLKPESDYCLTYLVPWQRHVRIHDTFHEKVQILINHKVELEVDIKNKPERFVVIAVVGSSSPGFQGCSIIPEGAPHIMTHRVVFGPETKKRCTEFLASNCSMAA